MNLTPADTGEIRNGAEPFIKESVQRARMAMGSTPNVSAAPPMNVTTAREDGDGVIHTVHPMVWGLDEWGDENSLWTKG